MNRVAEAMNPAFLSISPEQTLVDAARVMADRSVHHLLVMNGAELVGVVCSCDVKNADATKTTVADVMSRPAVSLASECPVEDAVATMLERRIGFLPVVEDGKVIGVLTRGDLARVLGEDRERGLVACKWCGSHRHVNFVALHDAVLCDDCVEDDDIVDAGEGD